MTITTIGSVAASPKTRDALITNKPVVYFRGDYDGANSVQCSKSLGALVCLCVNLMGIGIALAISSSLVARTRSTLSLIRGHTYMCIYIREVNELVYPIGTEPVEFPTKQKLGKVSLKKNVNR